MTKCHVFTGLPALHGAVCPGWGQPNQPDLAVLISLSAPPTLPPTTVGTVSSTDATVTAATTEATTVPIIPTVAPATIATTTVATTTTTTAATTTTTTEGPPTTTTGTKIHESGTAHCPRSPVPPPAGFPR